MRIYDFKVFFEPEETGGYVAVCPALAGCYSQGDTVTEAMSRRCRISKRRSSFASKICAPGARLSPTRPAFS
jgi:hypothetical protein